MENEQTSPLAEALRVLKLIAEQGGDIVEPWSAEIARQALIRITDEAANLSIGSGSRTG